MTPLTSRSGRVKAARRLTRRPSRAQARLFLAEGPQAVREALTVPGCVVEVFASGTAGSAHPDLRDAADGQGLPWQVVDERGLASLTDTVSPQGLLAVCRFLDRPLDHALKDAPALVTVCVDIRDPGNAGTVIRCADAAGSGAVVLAGDSVDAYNGKTVRATAGSLFHLPLVIHPDPIATIEQLRQRDYTVLAADGAGEVDLDRAIDDGLLTRRTAWLFGNEARGLADETTRIADHRVRIPVHGRAESLNLATAAAVCLYASARALRGR